MLIVFGHPTAWKPWRRSGLGKLAATPQTESSGKIISGDKRVFTVAQHIGNAHRLAIDLDPPLKREALRGTSYGRHGLVGRRAVA